jgi:FlaA1/EpsC-like NDP-sugar epimerase
MGSTTSINDIVTSKQIDKIIISITDVGREKLKSIYRLCEKTDKPVLRARISFDVLIDENANLIEESYLD